MTEREKNKVTKNCMACAAFGECNPNNDAGHCGYDETDSELETSKEIDMEALKRGQDNAAKIWTPEAVAEVIGTEFVPFHPCYWLRVECQTEVFERFRKDAAKLKLDFEFCFEIDRDKFEINLEDLKSALKQWQEAKESREPMTQQQQAGIMHPDDDMATFIRTIAGVERFHGIGE